MSVVGAAIKGFGKALSKRYNLDKKFKKMAKKRKG